MLVKQGAEPIDTTYILSNFEHESGKEFLSKQYRPCSDHCCLISLLIRWSLFLQDGSRSRSLGLFWKGKTNIIAVSPELS